MLGDLHVKYKIVVIKSVRA